MKKGIAIIITCALLVMTAAGCEAKDSTKKTAAAAETQKLEEMKTKLDKEFTDFLGPINLADMYLFLKRVLYF